MCFTIYVSSFNMCSFYMLQCCLIIPMFNDTQSYITVEMSLCYQKYYYHPVKVETAAISRNVCTPALETRPSVVLECLTKYVSSRRFSRVTEAELYLSQCNVDSCTAVKTVTVFRVHRHVHLVSSFPRMFAVIINN